MAQSLNSDHSLSDCSILGREIVFYREDRNQSLPHSTWIIPDEAGYLILCLMSGDNSVIVNRFTSSIRLSYPGVKRIEGVQEFVLAGRRARR